MNNRTQDFVTGTANLPPAYRARTERLPQRVDQVTRDWLTRTLQLRYAGLVVEEMEILEVISGHTTKVRVALELNEAGRAAGIPRQVCLKANWSGDPLSTQACVLEARFYHYFRDQLNVPAPVCYFADWDDGAQPQGLVIMEDLAGQGGHFGHSTRPISIEEARRALDGFAGLHAGLWGSPTLDQNQWLEMSMAPGTSDAALYQTLSKYMYINLENPQLRAVLPQWLLDDPERLGRGFERLVAHQRRETMPRCLIHGDAHLGNSFFRRDGSRIFMDFQLVTRAHPWRDLTYFLVGSLSIEDRRRAERELLQHYLERLDAHGAGGRLGFDKLWSEFQRWPMWGMVAWITNLDQWGQATLPSVERFYAAAADHDTLKLLEEG
ncbi:MAG: phosphotransferase [Porticoccaceae bacterium]